MRQITRALDLLESLAVAGEASLADLSTELDFPRASTHRLIVSLEKRGYVEHDEQAGVYRLGPSVVGLAAGRTESAIVRHAAVALTRLRATTGETINLATLSGSRIVYAATVSGLHQPRMSATVGQEVEAHATALGKAILAGLPPDRRAPLLLPGPYPAYTPATITDPSVLAIELGETAERGYATETEESTLGAACIATAIFARNGVPVGAISVSGVPARLPAESHAVIAADLRTWCETIGRQLDADPARGEEP